MAETKKKEPQGSIFKRTIVAAPIAVGGALGISKLKKYSNFFGKPVEILPFDSAENTVSKFENRYINKIHSGTTKDWQMDKLAGFSENIALSKEQLHSSWMRAAHAADPSGYTAATLGKRFQNAETSQHLIRDLMSSLQRNDSIYMSRTVHRFIDDVSLLNKRLVAGLPVNTRAVGMKVPKTTTYLKLTDLDPKMGEYLGKISKSLGSDVLIKQHSRSDMLGTMLSIELTGGKVKGKLRLDVPMPIQGMENIVARGTTQQSRYIAGKFVTVNRSGVADSVMNFGQYTMFRAHEDLLPELLRAQSARKQRQLVSTFTSMMQTSLTNIKHIPPGVSSARDSALALEQEIVHIHKAAAEAFSSRKGQMPVLSQLEYADIIKRGHIQLASGEKLPIFPAGSPNRISSSIASTVDLRAGSYLIPEAASYGRRPLKHIRSDFSPTASALEAMKAAGGEFDWLKDKNTINSPMIRTLYPSNKYAPKLTAYGFNPEGQGLITESVRPQRMVQRTHSFILDANHMLDLQFQGDSAAGRWALDQQVKQGAILGYSPEGLPVRAERDMRMFFAAAHEDDRARGDFIRVWGMSEAEDYSNAKVAGGMKGLMHERSDAVLAHAARAVGSDRAGVQAIVTMDELVKNRGLHYNQIFSALWEHTKANMASGHHHTELATNFAHNPYEAIQKINQMAKEGEHLNHGTILQEAYALARGAGLNPVQMGEVFGAVPEAFKPNQSALQDFMGKLTAAEQSEVLKGLPVGYAQFFHNAVEVGHGGLASIEPRVLELLNSPHLGGTGSAIKQEMIDRMIAGHPERIIEENLLAKALESTLNPQHVTGAQDAKAILASINQLGATGQNMIGSPRVGEKALLPAESTWLSLKGIGSVYIPGSGSLATFSDYRTPTGTTVHSHLTQAYGNILEAAEEYASGGLSEAGMRGELATLGKSLGEARINTVMGKGGLLRGKLPGSVALGIMQADESMGLRAGEAGISTEMGEKMFTGMSQLGMWSKEEIGSLRKKFLAGEAIAGVSVAHPAIGPYGTQVMNFRKIEGIGEMIAYQETFHSAVAKPGRLAAEEATAFAEQAMYAFRGQKPAFGIEALNPIRLSPAVGQARDYDGDTAHIMLAGPDKQAKLQTYLRSAEGRIAAEDYALRSQLLKSKAPGAADITLREVMYGDVLKLGVTKSGELGKTSNILQHARAALLSQRGTIGEADTMKGLGLLEAMEQIPISAKHVKAGQENLLLSSLADIREAFATKNKGLFVETLGDIFGLGTGEGNPVTKALLGEGATIAAQGPGGQVSHRFVAGLEAERIFDVLTGSMGVFEEQNLGTSIAGMREALRGRGLSMGDIQASLSREALSKSEFGSLFTQLAETEKGLLGKVLSGPMSTLESIGSIVKKNKGLAIAGASILGAAAVLTSPGVSKSGGAMVPPPQRLGGGSGGANASIDVVQEGSPPMGQPTVSDHTSMGNTARISSNRTGGHRIEIRGSANHNPNQASLWNGLGYTMNGRTNIDTRINDRRMSLTPQKVSDMVEKG